MSEFRKSEDRTRPKAKAKSALVIGDWAQRLDAVPLDAESSSEDEMLQRRSKKVCFELGKDEYGNALPDNDDSPYTPKQIYVLKKIIGTDEEKGKQFGALMLSKNKKDVKMFVNSQVPKGAAYSWGLAQSSSSSAANIERERTFTEQGTRSLQSMGVTYTEALGICAGDERILNTGPCAIGQPPWPRISLEFQDLSPHLVSSWGRKSSIWNIKLPFLPPNPLEKNPFTRSFCLPTRAWSTRPSILHNQA